MTGRQVASAMLLATLGPWAAAAAEGARPMGELVEMSLEELATMRVTSVSRRAESLAQAPASIYVISSEDIRRSGAATLAEALRLAPNLQVAQINSRTYAITARGFNSSIANKLLVMIDGRTVYSPVFSGVFWDQQDVMLEDVERIEVVSGPGATQWGANAVNGVINVITRPAGATQGALATGRAAQSYSGAAARYGGAVADTPFRLYATAKDFDATENARGVSLADGWRRWQAGLRADRTTPDGDLVLLADAYGGDARTATPLGTPSFSGASVLGRYTLRRADGAELRVQAFADRADRDDVLVFRDRMRTYDLEGQLALAPQGLHRVMVGGGYRQATDRVEPTPLVTFMPTTRDLSWANVFVQDEFQVTERVELMGGVKLERNVYTGWEVLPSLRLAWTPDPTELVWAALSRAVRAPARLDRDIFIPGRPPFLVAGGPDFQSEIANVLEIGYRASPSKATTFSITAFHNVYDRLRSARGAPAVIENGIEGRASGLEMSGTWQAASAWRLAAGATFLDQHLRLKTGSTDTTAPAALGNDPRFQWMLRSSATLARGLEADILVRRVGALPDPALPAYTAVDVRLGWHAAPQVELALGVRNAFDPGHPEFGNAATASQVPRTVFVSVAWRP